VRAKSFRLLLLLVTLLFALGLAGCGGDDDEAAEDTGATETTEGEAGGTLVFGSSSDFKLVPNTSAKYFRRPSRSKIGTA